jgi:hypothetical protein
MTLSPDADIKVGCTLRLMIFKRSSLILGWEVFRRETEQPVHPEPSNHITGGFPAAARSRASTTSGIKTWEIPRATADPAQIFRNSLLVKSILILSYIPKNGVRKMGSVLFLALSQLYLIILINQK